MSLGHNELKVYNITIFIYSLSQPVLMKICWKSRLMSAKIFAAKRHYCQTSNIRRILVWQWNCWSLRCIWSIACRRCSNYIFTLDLTPGFSGLGRDNCKTRRKSFKFWDFVSYIRDFTVLLSSCLNPILDSDEMKVVLIGDLGMPGAIQL